jgi:hypothetical protein
VYRKLECCGLEWLSSNFFSRNEAAMWAAEAHFYIKREQDERAVLAFHKSFNILTLLLYARK